MRSLKTCSRKCGVMKAKSTLSKSFEYFQDIFVYLWSLDRPDSKNGNQRPLRPFLAFVFSRSKRPNFTFLESAGSHDSEYVWDLGLSRLFQCAIGVCSLSLMKVGRCTKRCMNTVGVFFRLLYSLNFLICMNYFFGRLTLFVHCSDF